MGLEIRRGKTGGGAAHRGTPLQQMSSGRVMLFKLETNLGRSSGEFVYGCE